MIYTFNFIFLAQPLSGNEKSLARACIRLSPTRHPFTIHVLGTIFHRSYLWLWRRKKLCFNLIMVLQSVCGWRGVYAMWMAINLLKIIGSTPGRFLLAIEFSDYL